MGKSEKRIKKILIFLFDFSFFYIFAMFYTLF